MSLESVEAFIERIMPDMALLEKTMENENISDRTEFIVTEIFRRILDELRQLQWELIDEGLDRSAEDDFCVDNASSVHKGSSPKNAGYACPTKDIEQRFSDTDG